MIAKVFSYPIIIQETYLDSFGHMNNAIYLTLFEKARWDFINKNGYGIKKIKETSLGPTIIEIKINYLKEILPRDELIIESQLLSYKNKIGILTQKMIRSNEECCLAEFKFGLFNLTERKLVLPTPDWLRALGVEKLK